MSLPVNYDAALEQMQAHGLVVDTIDTSGRIVRVDCEDRPRKKHGWYVAHEIALDDGRVFVVGRYGDLRLGEGGDGRGGTGHAIELTGIKLSDAARAELKRKKAEQRRAADQVRDELAAEAAMRAARLWPRLPQEGRSRYLQRKGVRAWGVRFVRGSLVVPLRNAGGELVGLQFIDEAGGKKFLTGTAKRGAWHWLGDPTSTGQPLAIAEGYATAATIHEATGWPVACAFDAGNLSIVYDAIATRHRQRTIVVCGDDDHETDGNPGRAKATALARRHAMPLAIPVFRAPAGRTDWNDLLLEQGVDEVRRQLEACRTARPPTPSRAGAIEFSLSVLLAHFTLVHGTNLVYDDRRGRLMAVGNLNHSAGRAVVQDWLRHPGRMVVNEEDVVFNPANTPSERPQVNLFTGMRVVPAPTASCARLVHHLHLLCGERDRLFDWVVKWLAYPLQHPGTKMSTALVMYGSEGTGKNIFFETMLDIYERWGVLIGQEEIESQFNGWLSAKLFAVADEVVSRAELRHLKGRLKKLVTGQRVMVNEKNQPVRAEKNAMNIVFLSNEDEPLRLDPGDRRYCAVRCDHIEDKTYFEALGSEIAAGGAAALYHYLLQYDLEDFSPWTRPYETDERDGLMQTGAAPPLRFWAEWQDDELPLPVVSCRCQDLYQAFRAWCSISGERFIPNDTQFGTSLRPFEGARYRKDRPRIIDNSGQARRPKCYVLPEVTERDGTTIADQVEQFKTAADEYINLAKRVRL